jgi:toxin YoeB
MARYTLKITDTAKKHLITLHASGNKAIIKRIDRIFEELSLHPYLGIGKPEALKHNLAGYWSRRIDDKNRIVYQVDNENIIVIIIAAKGHYSDK